MSINLRTARHDLFILTALAMALAFGATALAAPPDLTAGGVPGDTLTINLGPTGARGWVYHVKTNTAESRQILVTAVDARSPAAGILEADDLILGADGTGTNPGNFTADARKSLADAIADSEARTPANLKLLRWRSGTTSIIQLNLRTLGSYSATAPYNCPKSATILEEGLQFIMAAETAGRYSFGTLSLLAGNDPANPNNAARQARARSEARALIPSAATMAQLTSDERDGTSMITWQRGHTLIVLTEYYLQTRDAQVLPAIEAYAVNIAKNQSLFGTVGHIFAEKNPDGSHNGPMGGVYGPVNSSGMPCFLGLLLARECGLTNPEIEPAIERSSRFFAYYAGKGSVPYGEHEAYWQGHESNGKSGLAALAFALLDDRVDEGRFFAKMATASTSERETGHTGAFFNYLWAPLGAAAGGEEAAAAHFSGIRWMLDLNRRWDGSFAYDCLNGEGPNSGPQYNDFRMSTAALQVYALPLRQLHLTGRGHDPVRWLNRAEITEAEFSDTYHAPSRSTSELVTDLGNWSPKVQRLAAYQLATRTTQTTALLPTLNALANDTTGSSRVGACLALGKIGNANSAPVLAALLTDPENHVRYAAAEGMRYLPTSAKLGQLNAILAAAASTGTPLLPYNEEDPLHFAHARLAMLLFYGGNAYGPKGILWNSVSGIDRNLLYPAIRAVAANPIGQARSTLTETYKRLTLADVNALADTIVDSIHDRAPADKMFSAGIRQGGLVILQQHGIAEGVPLGMIYDRTDGRDSVTSDVLGVLQAYAGSSTTVVPDPDVRGYLSNLLTGSKAAEAQAVLDAIAADPSPVPLAPFKSIQSVTADSPSLTLPARQTVLRVNAIDQAKGDSTFNWRKIHGAGAVSFSTNASPASADTAIDFEAIPGRYLFEVTMSDSRGLTEVSSTVPINVLNSAGVLPPNDPPVAHSQEVSLTQGTPTPVTLGGSDPEGYPLVYTVTAKPAHGNLSGIVPDLIYTPDILYTGIDSFSFEIMDSEGQLAAATVTLSISDMSSIGVAVYEPFDYPTGPLAGRAGSSEVGLSGAWSADATTAVVATSLTHLALPANGGSIGNLSASQNKFGGSRPLSASALAERGLLDDGATLWFSVMVGYDAGGNVTNSRLALALANSPFNSANYDYWIKNEGSQLGSGIGLVLGRINNTNGRVVAAQFRDLASGDGLNGNILGTWEGNGITYGTAQHGLIVGKITWGATPEATDTVTLYQPGSNLDLPSSPLSILTTTVDQTTFDTITFARGDKVAMDEIRFGPSYPSVLFGTTEIARSDYEIWAAGFPSANLSDPNGDHDRDRLSNQEEWIWGLDPTDPTAARILSAPPGAASDSLSYKRRKPALAGRGYRYQWSSTLTTDSWTFFTPITEVSDNASPVELVEITLPPVLLAKPALFIRVVATPD